MSLGRSRWHDVRLCRRHLKLIHSHLHLMFFIDSKRKPRLRASISSGFCSILSNVMQTLLQAATPCTGTNQQWQLSGSQVEYESTRQQLTCIIGYLDHSKGFGFNYALPFLKLSPFINHQTAPLSLGVFRFPKTHTCKKKVQDHARLEY